jgi:hypothetical protein
MTLIELEQTEKRARESCRQYLPESSSAVLHAFSKYLDTVLDECRRRMDRRFDAFRKLKSVLNARADILVRTAGALRASADLLEVFPLCDQTDQPAILPEAAVTPQSPFVFDGVRSLVRTDRDLLRRAVRIVHAIATRKDHDGGSLDGFSRRNPLRRILDTESSRYPELIKLVSQNDKTGGRVDCGRIAKELTEIMAASGQHVEPARIRNWIEEVHRLASQFSKQSPIQQVFEQARSVMSIERNQNGT